jgi:hypothetical protein
MRSEKRASTPLERHIFRFSCERRPKSARRAMKEQSLVGALSERADEARESTDDLSRHFGQKVCRSKR